MTDKALYYVYLRGNDNGFVVSYNEIPSLQMKGKRKYAGKKAKIEAVYRLNGYRIPDYYTAAQINDYLGANLFNTSQWHSYRMLLDEVQSEKTVVSESYLFQYSLEVEFRTPVDPKDERIVHMVTCELLGSPLEMFGGLKNPIVSLKKRYDENPR
jgi:hypothetical protein